MEGEPINNEDMNEILLNLKIDESNKNIVENNVEKIAKKLSEIDPEKDKHKYLTLSCIFSAFLGDSIGSCCEFSSPSKENHKGIFSKNNYFLPGEVTDDSEMAMSSAFAYIDAINENSSRIQDIIYYYFCIWRTTGPKDIGGATSNALRFWKEGNIDETKYNYKMVKALNWESLANGFLMRISTFITFYYYTHIDIIYHLIENYFDSKKEKDDELSKEMLNLFTDIFVESSKNTEITHPNYENGISSAVFTLLVFVGMVKKDAKLCYLLFNQISNSKKFIEFNSNSQINRYAEQTQKKYKKIIDEIENKKEISVYNLMGYYLHGFKLSIHFLKKMSEMELDKEEDLYYRIMCEVCDYGGDTDTNCAIVGAMIGPLIGYKNFKKELFDTFIRYIPQHRSQFNSAFMYIYVDYLEKKLLKNEIIKKEDNNDEVKDDISKEEKNEGSAIPKNEKDKDNKETEKEKFLWGNSKDGITIGSFKYTALNKILEFLKKEIII